MKTKTCCVCGNEFPATREYFNRNRKAKDCLDYACKKCRREASRRYRQRNPELVKKYNKKWNKKLTAIKSSEHRSPKHDLMTGKRCVVCGGDLMGNLKRCPQCVEDGRPVPDTEDTGMLTMNEITHVCNMDLLI